MKIQKDRKEEYRKTYMSLLERAVSENNLSFYLEEELTPSELSFLTNEILAIIDKSDEDKFISAALEDFLDDYYNNDLIISNSKLKIIELFLCLKNLEERKWRKSYYSKDLNMSLLIDNVFNSALEVLSVFRYRDRHEKAIMPYVFRFIDKDFFEKRDKRNFYQKVLKMSTPDILCIEKSCLLLELLNSYMGNDSNQLLFSCLEGGDYKGAQKLLEKNDSFFRLSDRKTLGVSNLVTLSTSIAFSDFQDISHSLLGSKKIMELYVERDREISKAFSSGKSKKEIRAILKTYNEGRIAEAYKEIKGITLNQYFTLKDLETKLSDIFEEIFILKVTYSYFLEKEFFKEYRNLIEERSH